MLAFKRRLYQLILRLHPSAFRHRFAREMALDFEDALATYGFSRLLIDATYSLVRQWIAVPVYFARTAQGPMPAHPLLAGQYLAIDDDNLKPFELARGSVLFVILFFFVGLALNRPNQHPLPTLHQSLLSGQKGGLGVDNRQPDSAASNPDAHTPANAQDAPVYVGSYSISQLKLLRKRLRNGHPFSNPSSTHARLKVVQPLREFLLRCVLLTAVIWLTSLLIRRSRSIPARIALIAIGLLAATLTAVASPLHPPATTHAQLLHPTGPLPSFEVATLKPWQRPPAPPPPPPGSANPPKPIGPAKIAPGKPGGQLSDRVHSILPARLLIAFAYNIPFGAEDARVLGGPDWASSDQYEFQAKIDDTLFAAMQKMTAPQQREQVDLMEQSLLADRFKLKVHFETRDMPAYVLTIASGGPKLTPAKDGEPTRLSMSGNVMTATAVTLDDWAQSPFLNGHRTIVNQTGLTGKYDFTLTWSPDQPTTNDTPADSGDTAPPLLTAVQQQLGLRLVPTKAPVEVIVIDHIERPTPN